jgi:hypothetical protein
MRSANGSARQPSLRSGGAASQPQRVEALKKKLVNGGRRQRLIEGALQLVASVDHCLVAYTISP